MGLLWVHIVREVSGRIHQKADLETKLTWRRVIVSVHRNSPCKGVRKAGWDRRSRAVLAVKTTASASQVGTSGAQRTWYLTWVWKFYTLTWARCSVWVALMQGEAPFPKGAMLGTASCQKFWQLQAWVPQCWRELGNGPQQPPRGPPILSCQGKPAMFSYK